MTQVLSNYTFYMQSTHKRQISRANPKSNLKKLRKMKFCWASNPHPWCWGEGDLTTTLTELSQFFSAALLLNLCVHDPTATGAEGTVFKLPSAKDSFNDNGFASGKLLWRSEKLLISDGAASSSGVVVICLPSLWRSLWWCRRRRIDAGFLHRFILSFQFCKVCSFVTCNLFLSYE
jgi:hypothetical protein